MTPMSIAPPLREIAERKIDQFNQLKQDFKARYKIGVPPRTDVTPIERITTLLGNINQFDSYLEDDDDVTAIARHIEQIEGDCCLSKDKLLKFEKQIMDKLHKQLSRYEATSLHLDLMKEVMESNQPGRSLSSGLHAASLEDDFEVVEDGPEALWEKFEAEAFTAKDVDPEALEAYLTGLMEGNGFSASLGRLQDDMRRYGEETLNGEAEIEVDELEWCIMDLLKNDLINDDKKKTLESYIQSQVAIKELVGVLNMKSISQWNWESASKGVPVTARQDLEGQYHITIEEDLIDTLFLHCVAIGWARKLKECLSDYIRYMNLGGKRSLSSNDRKEQEFFLEMMPYEPAPPPEPCPEMSECPPLPVPPPPPPGAYMGVPNGVYIIPSPSKKKSKKKVSKLYPGPVCVMPPPPPPPPPFPMGVPPPPPPPMSIFPMSPDILDNERHRVYKRDFFMSRLPTQNGCRLKVVPFKEAQANLIKTLATEIKLRAAFDGQPTCSVVDFHSLATAIPHKTVLVVMKFLGVPEVFINFFARYLAVNLNIGPSARGKRDRVLTRACGVPERHGLELLFTEAVMFFAELAVTQKVGLPMYRLESRCYFVGTEEQSDAVLQELAIFSQHMKLDFDDVSVQPERLHIGFLELAGNAVTIKQSAVDAYAHRIKKQLSAQTTVYDWVRVWNSTMGTYAAHLFGPLVDLFGKSHLHSVKATYHQMLGIIFESGGLTHHVKTMLRARSDFARTSTPLALEAIIYLPQSFGGLGVKNPLIVLNLARNINPDPNTIIQEYLDVETKYHEAALDNWSMLTPDHITKKLSAVFQNNDEVIAASLGGEYVPSRFISKADLTRHREYVLFPQLPYALLHDLPIPPRPQDGHLPYLVGLYQALLNEPVDDIIASERVREEVRECGPCKRWDKLSAEDRWVLQMYGGECFERYGSLDVWCERYVPGICMMMARGLEGLVDDDGTSYSSMTSVA